MATDDIDFDALTPQQQEVLGQIALNNDAGHNRRTLEALIKKGLIEEYEETLLHARFPVRVKRYVTPIWVHIQWCQWQSEKLKMEERTLIQKLAQVLEKVLASTPQVPQETVREAESVLAEAEEFLEET